LIGLLRDQEKIVTLCQRNFTIYHGSAFRIAGHSIPNYFTEESAVDVICHYDEGDGRNVIRLRLSCRVTASFLIFKRLILKRLKSFKNRIYAYKP